MPRENQMELKDWIVPSVTLIGFFIVARLNLRNEIAKKGLEIRSSRLETTAEECDKALESLLHYAQTITTVIEVRYTLIEEPKKNNNENLNISIGELHKIKYTLDQSSQKFDIEAMQRAKRIISFHYSQEFDKWRKYTLQPQQKIMEFFMITQVGTTPIDLKNKIRTKAEAFEFTSTLRKQCEELIFYREDLTERLADEFYLITTPYKKKATLKNFISKMKDSYNTFFYG